MKSILISIKPKWTAKILNGEKTIEVRKTAPKCELPCEVYIYCTKGKPYLLRSGNRFGLLRENLRYTCIDKETAMNGKVVAKFTLNKVSELAIVPSSDYLYSIKENEQVSVHQECWIHKTCLTNIDLLNYLQRKNGYAWHIDNLVIFDKPKELNDFGVKRSPQSWQFIEVDE